MVFGHVIEGKEVVNEIESQKVDENSRPLAEVQISSCGELVLQVRPKGMPAIYESSFGLSYASVIFWVAVRLSRHLTANLELAWTGGI